MKLICQLFPRRVLICRSLVVTMCAAGAWSFSSYAEIGASALGELKRFAFTGQFRFQMHRPSKAVHYKRVRPAMVVASRFMAVPRSMDRTYRSAASQPMPAARVADTGDKLTFLGASGKARNSSNPAINIPSAGARLRAKPAKPGRPVIPLPTQYLEAKKQIAAVVRPRRSVAGPLLTHRAGLGVGSPQKPIYRKGKAVAALTAPLAQAPTNAVPALPPLPQAYLNRPKVEVKKTNWRARRRSRSSRSQSRGASTPQTPPSASGSSWISSSPKWANRAFRGD